MPFKVHVQNFQSIGDVSVEVSGLTVITGPNNSGKTALIRSIHGAFTNARGTSFVRQGESSAQVEVLFSDGRSLVWEKGSKVNRYEIDGAPLNRVGAGVPSEVGTLGVTSIEAAGRELWPQFAQQFVGQIFLLNEPGSVLAEAIANVDKVGVLNEALRFSQTDRRAAQAELKLRQEDVSTQEANLAFFNGLDDVVSKIDTLKTLESENTKARVRLDVLSGIAIKWGQALNDVSHLSLVRKTFEVDPHFETTLRESQSLLNSLLRLKAQFTSGEAAVSALSSVRSLPVWDDTLHTRVKRINAALVWARDLEQRLIRTRHERDQASKALDAAQKTSLPDLTDMQSTYRHLQELVVFSKKWRDASKAVEDLKVANSESQRDFLKSEADLKSLFQESGHCPFCGVPNEDHSC